MITSAMVVIQTATVLDRSIMAIVIPFETNAELFIRIRTEQISTGVHNTANEPRKSMVVLMHFFNFNLFLTCLNQALLNEVVEVAEEC